METQSKTHQKQLLSKEELLELAQANNTHCISIYIPTHRAGEETLQGKDALNLKNQLKEIKSKLEDQGLTIDEIEALTKPIRDLCNDKEFWRHQSDGLAVFLSDSEFQTFTLPIPFEEFNYLSNEFYIKPLIPIINGDGLFYLLTLKKDEVKLFEGTKHSIEEILINDLIPSRMEDRVGYDYEQKTLQFRTQQGNKGAGSFHGHLDNDSVEKQELKQYFRAIDQGLMELLNCNQNPPLVVCSVDFYFPIYQEVNTYQNLYPQPISGDPSNKGILVLHEEALELLSPYFDKAKQEKLDLISSLAGTEKASSDIRELVNSAFEGKIDTLFLEKSSDIFGTYNPTKREVNVENQHNPPNVSLMNLLAKKVLETQGKVYLMDKEDMPIKSEKINALFRY